jgi:arginine/lysine/ornithine decarboxylase
MDYVLGMTSIFDSRDGFQRLGDALLEIDKTISVAEVQSEQYKILSNMEISVPEAPEIIIGLKDAIDYPSETMSLSDSEGRVTAEYIYLYPPGIPLLVPGEKINKELLYRIKSLKESGLMIQGMDDINGNNIRVVQRP